jgi:hypothetical protein
VEFPVKARLAISNTEDFGQIEVPGVTAEDLPLIVKHRGRYFDFDGTSKPGNDGDEELAHYREIQPSAFYDHDAARGVR